MTPGHENIDYERGVPACEDPTFDEEVPKSWLEGYREDQGLRVAPEYSRGAGETDDRALLADIAFNRHSMNDGHHVSPFDNNTIEVGVDGITVDLVQGIDEDAFMRTLSAATRATIGIDIDKGLPGQWEHCQEFCDWLKAQIREAGYEPYEVKNFEFSCDKHGSVHKYEASLLGESHFQGQLPMNDWEEMLKGGLQTALETQVIVFAVKGASRTCTHQLVRSRRAAFHQQSQRASWMGDGPEFRMPESVYKIPEVRKTWFQAVIATWRAYRAACDSDVSYQDSRFILPEGTCNFIMLEYPVREFLNVYAYRGCSMFQWEIVDVMRKCRAALVEAHPWIEPYVKISCEKTGPATVTIPIDRLNPIQPNITTEQVPHHCTFQGWENVEGQCDFPWALEEARTFKPAHHKIERKQ